LQQGWRFVTSDEKHQPAMTSPKRLFGFKLMRELYLTPNPECKGKFSIPVLWDSKTSTFVNNESAEIIVMLSNEFNALAKHSKTDLYPFAMRRTIDEVANSFLYGLNSSVYRCGQATNQSSYLRRGTYGRHADDDPCRGHTGPFALHMWSEP
jgi:glutathionyl-hydroquinone reductase